MKYKITLEGRELGAIGTFSQMILTVESDNDLNLKPFELFEKIQEKNIEPNIILNIERYYDINL